MENNALVKFENLEKNVYLLLFTDPQMVDALMVFASADKVIRCR
jgi:hypothetical protein